MPDRPTPADQHEAAFLFVLGSFVFVMCALGVAGLSGLPL